MKQTVMVANIGYSKYIVEPDDAVALLQIAQRCRRCEGWNPQIISEEQSAFVSSVSLEEVDFPDDGSMPVKATPTLPPVQF
jgi:hypothetical protein